MTDFSTALVQFLRVNPNASWTVFKDNLELINELDTVIPEIDSGKRIAQTWVNISKDRDYIKTEAFNSREVADAMAWPSRIACVYREFEYMEGEGLFRYPCGCFLLAGCNCQVKRS